MYKSQFEGAEADRRLALIDSINEQLCPKRSGTLPLTIDSIGGNLSDWTIHGNSEGVGERTKNYANVETGKIINGVTFTVDSAAGTVTANGTATKIAQLEISINDFNKPNYSNVPPGNYYFSGCPSGGSGPTYDCYSWDYDTNTRSKQWDGTTNVESDFGQGNCQVQINGHRQTITIRIQKDYTANNLVFKPMLRAVDTTPDFIPYGYQVPLDIRSLSDTNEINEKCDYHTNGDGATIDLDEKTGTITINGTTGNSGATVWIVMDKLQGSYWYSGIPKSQEGVIAYAKMEPLSSVASYYNKWDGTPPDPSTDLDYGEGAEALCDTSLSIYYAEYVLHFAPNHTFNNFVIKPKVQKATITTHKDIYTGSSPLTEGQSVSRDSTGIEIEVEQGTSVIETTLTNKPEMDAKIDRIKMIEQTLISMQSSGGYNETQTDYITDNVEEVTQ